MAITRARKEELLAQYKELLNQSGAIFLADYTGLNVKQVEALRNKAREAGGALHITKNTLLRKALEEEGLAVPSELLNGQIITGFVLGEIPSVAKTLTNYARDEAKFVIRGGVLGKSALSAEDVKALATLPPLEQLRAQLLGMISAPARGVVSAVANGVRQLVNVLDAYAKQAEGVESPEAAA